MRRLAAFTVHFSLKRKIHHSAKKPILSNLQERQLNTIKRDEAICMSPIGKFAVNDFFEEEGTSFSKETYPTCKKVS